MMRRGVILLRQMLVPCGSIGHRVTAPNNATVMTMATFRAASPTARLRGLIR